MESVIPNGNFSLNVTGDSRVIIYSRDRYGIQLVFGVFLLICIFSAVSLFFTDAVTHLGWTGFFIFSSALTSAVILAANYFLRTKGTFTITGNEINIDGQHYSRDHIRRLTVVTPKGQVARSSNVQGGTVIIGGPAIPVAATVIGRQTVAVGAEILDKIIQLIGDGIREVNYKLVFQYGNKEIKLAGGMSEKNAVYLFDCLVDIMD